MTTPDGATISSVRPVVEKTVDLMQASRGQTIVPADMLQPRHVEFSLTQNTIKRSILRIVRQYL